MTKDSFVGVGEIDLPSADPNREGPHWTVLWPPEHHDWAQDLSGLTGESEQEVTGAAARYSRKTVAIVVGDGISGAAL